MDYKTAYNMPLSALQLNVKILSDWLNTENNNNDEDDAMKLFRPL